MIRPSAERDALVRESLSWPCCRRSRGAPPPPLAGEGWGGGYPTDTALVTPPPPTPPHKGEGSTESGAHLTCVATVSLVSLRERIGLDEIGGLVDQFVLAVSLGAADAGLR